MFAFWRRPFGIVLMYHRVVKEVPSLDPYRLCVTQERFEEHLDEILGVFPIEKPSRFPKRVIKNAVGITFDDGYADNAENAFPILRARNLPAAFFLTTGPIDNQEGFFWDEEPSRAMTWDDARMMASAGMEIGAHTVTHPRLIECSRSAALEEMMRSRDRIEEELGARPSLFAYPYGDRLSISGESVDAAREAGFTGAFTTEQRAVRRRDDPFRIPRLAVRNWPGEELVRRIEAALAGRPEPG